LYRQQSAATDASVVQTGSQASTDATVVQTIHILYLFRQAFKLPQMQQLYLQGTYRQSAATDAEML
jgi:hypothetical protein